MPSKDRPTYLRKMLDQPGLTPREAKDMEQWAEQHARNEDARFVGMAQQDVAHVDVMRQEQEDRLKQFVLTDVSERAAQAKSRRMSAKEIAALRNEIQEVVAYFEGDDERQGVINTIESGYARAERVIEDPGAAADAFYRKWGGALAESRYR